EHLHDGPRLYRHTHRRVGVAAQRDFDLGTNAGPDRLLHRGGIVDRADCGILDLRVDQRLQDRCRVVVAAASRVVGPVGDHYGAGLVTLGAGGSDAIRHRPVIGRVLVAPAPDL